MARGRRQERQLRHRLVGRQGGLGGVPGNCRGRGGVARRGTYRAHRRRGQSQGIHAGPRLSAAGRFRGPLGDDRGREEVLRAAREVVSEELPRVRRRRFDAASARRRPQLQRRSSASGVGRVSGDATHRGVRCTRVDHRKGRGTWKWKSTKQHGPHRLTRRPRAGRRLR
ncbi:hypothetical protein BLAT2472_50024 [Burkholderia latens]